MGECFLNKQVGQHTTWDSSSRPGRLVWYRELLLSFSRGDDNKSVSSIVLRLLLSTTIPCPREPTSLFSGELLLQEGDHGSEHARYCILSSKQRIVPEEVLLTVLG